MRHWWWFAAVGLVMFALAPLARAQQVKEPSLFGTSVGSGARALGMGGAFIAVADDATAASWNPAGLCVLERPEASIAGQPRAIYNTDIASYDYRFHNPGFETFTYRADGFHFSQKSFAVDFASVTIPVRLGSVKLVPQVNYQRVIDFGLDFTYRFSYSGVDRVALPPIPSTLRPEEGESGVLKKRFNGSSAYTGENSGGLDLLAGSLGLAFTEKVYFGMSVNRWGNGAQGAISFTSNETSHDARGVVSNTTGGGRNTVSESFRGTNVSLGVLFKPTRKINIGLVFKTPFTMEYERTRVARSFTFGEETSRSTAVRKGRIRWPRTWGAGVAFMPRDSLTLSYDFTTTRWSRAEIDMEETITRVSGSSSETSRVSGVRTYPGLYDPSAPQRVGNPRQVDSAQLRFGAEYVIRKPGFLRLVVLPVRAGGYVDRQLFKDDATLSPVNYFGLTAGFGLVWSRLSLDFAYLRLHGESHSGDSQSTRGGVTESVTTDAPDKFRSGRFFASAIVRF